MKDRIGDAMVWLFPILFKSDIKNDILIDENKLKLRRMADEEIYDLFKIGDVKRNENGLIKSFSSEGVGPFALNPFSALQLNENYLIMSSQYILEAEEIEYVEWFQQALKLYKNGKTGAFWGFRLKPPQFNYIHPNPFYGKEIYSLDEVEITKIKELYVSIEKTRKNKHYNLMIEKFLFALSGLGIKDENRFLELVTVLEMLYNPKEKTELRFRFSLRACKVLSKYESMESDTTFNDMKKIYDIRSAISHSGYHNEASEYLNKLIVYTRKSLALFLKEPSIFDDENLDEICVKNWGTS